MLSLAGNIRIGAIALFAASAAVFALIFYRFHFPVSIVATDALSSAALLTFTVWIGISVVKAYPTKVGILIYACLIGIACGVLAWYLDKLALGWWFHTDKVYTNWLQRTKLTRLIIALLVNVWLITTAAISQRSSVLEHQFKNMTDAASLHREAELFKLRQQLQPHFLYNSLNSISALILIQPEKAQEMIGKLSDFLRNSVKREAREQIPVDEELEYIEAYLAIEAVRFGDRLQVSYDKRYSDHATIPPFLLQPLLENAIKFGLYGKTGTVKIEMSIELQSGCLIITISNPFDANNRPPSGTGFGLEGIQRRLYLLYARADLLETRHDNEIFTTTLKIPQAHVQGNID
jgi:two-component system, LytTR family, sensor kinase